MIVTNLKITNMFGIEEFEASGKDIELLGANGTGKTSVVDAIRYVLTNRSVRDVIIKDNGAEGSVIIETNTGLSIERTKRRDKGDVVKIRENGEVIDGTPEAFLRTLFTQLQLDPVAFLSMDTKEQNRVILDLIEFEWDMDWIIEQFGERVPDVDYGCNILRVLHQIQSEKGYYYLKRQDINREAYHNRTHIEKIGATLPEGYNGNKWKSVNLAEKFEALETARYGNAKIEKAKAYVDNANNELRRLKADYAAECAVIEQASDRTKTTLEKEVIQLRDRLAAIELEISGIDERKSDKLKIAKAEHEASVAEFTSGIEEQKKIAQGVMVDTLPLEEEAKLAEDMKAYIYEYERMVGMQLDGEKLVADAEELTEKIEKARTLPGEILQNCEVPVDNLTIVDGEPRINGRPINNLSDGEKLMLCIDVAKAKKSSLELLLLDGLEKLSPENRDDTYKKCKDAGVRFIATRTTDNENLTVVEL